MEGAKAAVSVNDSNGIVKQSQWNRCTKSMELFNKTNGTVA
jgi:hypothetical protein